MHLCVLLTALLSKSVFGSKECLPVNPIPFTLTQAYCTQPIYFNLLIDTPENRMLDNLCITMYPLPDRPDMFTVYYSRVYCDGSNEITTFIGAQISPVSNIQASLYYTLQDRVLGYIGCDTVIAYHCTLVGDQPPQIIGASTTCTPLGFSCLHKIREIIDANGLPQEKLYVLPMKLPNRCVTQQLCVLPPNPFYNKLSEHVGNSAD